MSSFSFFDLVYRLASYADLTLSFESERGSRASTANEEVRGCHTKDSIPVKRRVRCYRVACSDDFGTRHVTASRAKPERECRRCRGLIDYANVTKNDVRASDVGCDVDTTSSRRWVENVCSQRCSQRDWSDSEWTICCHDDLLLS